MSGGRDTAKNSVTGLNARSQEKTRCETTA